jgi:2-iminobutanoate/2-iminopropanoate deaminase
MKRIAMGLVWMLLVAACGPGSAERETKRIIVTAEAPKAIGPYSQGVLVGDLLFCSGQIGIDPGTGKLVEGDVRDQARQALQNLGAVLRAAGMDYDDVVRATVYLADLSDYAAMNEVYAEFFKESPPARAAMQVARLPRDAKVEISCIAMAQ